MEIFIALLRTTRPRQWLKNLALMAALVFSGLLFTPGMFWRTTGAVLAFTLLSGGVYIFNDLADVKADKLHPYKKSRPIAAGDLPEPVAGVASVAMILMALFWMQILSYFLFWIGLIYLGLQIAYTGYLKKVPIIDVLVVASGYVLRVYGGALAIEAHMDVWFLLTVISASLFLAVGKRRGERTLLLGSGITANVRTTLKRYTDELLNLYTAMFATATWLTYAIFTFNQPRIIPTGRVLTLMASLPRTLISEKLLMITVPFVVYGVMRYLQLIYERNEGESPERILLSDKPLMTTITIWGVLVIGILYYLG
jgi:4-hydroxybenzoate polyprenyltransferase